LNLVVLDASVAAKWLVWAGEPFEAEALGLLNQRNEGQIDFVVPDLFWAEIGNVIWKAAHRGRCSLDQAGESIRALQNYDLATAPSDELLHEALRIAHRYQRSFYDSIYLALAVSQQIEFVTADERLANAVAAHLPVKWLGARSNIVSIV
jgi:predicted nucleic acid-binding protein